MKKRLHVNRTFSCSSYHWNLAAIGILAYDGYTSKAKVSAAKSNCKTVIKYLRNEIIKCQAGVGPWLNYHPNCPLLVDYYKIFNSGGTVLIWQLMHFQE